MFTFKLLFQSSGVVYIYLQLCTFPVFLIVFLFFYFYEIKKMG